MRLARFSKQPDERKRYVIDYSDWLDSGETITSVVFAVTPVTANQLQVDAFTIASPATSVVFFVNDGTDDATYTLEVTTTTSGGQVKKDQVLFAVRES
jgi:hypothetical protein